MIDQAIKYGQLGWKVFPVNGKVPAIKGWQNAATDDPEKLKELFKVSHTGIGLATGKVSGCTVVDIDNKNGGNGFKTLEDQNIVLDLTICSETPGGDKGVQCFYRYCDEIKNKISVLGSKSGIDIKNDGGLVVLPPSIHPNGKSYQWKEGQSPGEVEIALFPKKLLKLIKEYEKKGLDQKTKFNLPDKIVNGQRNDILFRFARSLSGSGESENDILSVVVKANQERSEEPLADSEIATIVKNACSYDKPTVYMNMNGKVKKTLLNVIGSFSIDPNLTGLFYYNLFDGNIHYSRSPIWSSEIKAEKRLDDVDLVFVKHYLASNHKLEVMVYLIQESIIVVAHQNARHPVQEYLNSLKWDGKERLNQWLALTVGVEDNIYTSCLGRKTLMGAVARVFIPGIKFDYMLILEGPQGIGKSTLVKTLAGKWYTAISLTDTDKDTIDAMLGAWIIENEEMVCFSKQDIERVKAFISRSTDRVRLAYDRRSKDFPRQSIFIGTINPTGDSDYLKDSTGNRRFWPIVCAKVDIEWLKENRDQLFAEAVACFKAGEKLWIDSNDPKINELVLSEQEERKSRDPWTSKINEFVKGKRVVSSIEILESCLKIETPRITKNDQTRVGIVMSELKWKNKYNGKLKCREYWDSSKLILKTTFENAFATVEKTTFEKELSNGKKIFDWLVQALRLHPVSETRARVPGYPNNLDPYIGGISSAEFEAIIKILKRADLSWGAEIFNWLIERRYLERVTDTEACLCGSLSKVEKDLKDVYPDVCDKIFSFLEHYEDEED